MPKVRKRRLEKSDVETVDNFIWYCNETGEATKDEPENIKDQGSRKPYKSSNIERKWIETQEGKIWSCLKSVE